MIGPWAVPNDPRITGHRPAPLPVQCPICGDFYTPLAELCPTCGSPAHPYEPKGST